MEILKTISAYASEKKLPFILIGGHAVNFYGISRQTGDIDLLVRLDDKPAWDTILTSLKYVTDQNDSRFARYRPHEIAAWPIDLMFVNSTTFEKLFSESRKETIGRADGIPVASARNLIALKLHALKHFQEHRFAKDFHDLLGLLRLKSHNLSKGDFRELCLRYASEELFYKMKDEVNRIWP